MAEVADFKRVDHECPSCGWRLVSVGFCIHYDDEGARTFHDAVPAKVTRQEWSEAREAERALSQNPLAPEARKEGAPREPPSNPIATLKQL